MSYARDPFDTDQPPCYCHLVGEECCPAHGDPDSGITVVPLDEEDAGPCHA